MSALTTSRETILATIREPSCLTSDNVHSARIPEWAGFITLAANIAESRVEWCAYAHGPHGRRVCVSYGTFCVNDHPSETRTKLREIFTKQWASDHMRPQSPIRIGLDVGGRRVFGFTDLKNYIELKGVTGGDPLTGSPTILMKKCAHNSSPSLALINIGVWAECVTLIEMQEDNEASQPDHPQSLKLYNAALAELARIPTLSQDDWQNHFEREGIIR